MTETFFTSDTHFGHERIIPLCNRPFASVEEMNEAMVERWNSVVGSNDTVYHMGDVAMGIRRETLPIVSRLNGKLILTPGNHDNCWNKLRNWEKFAIVYEEVGFEIRQPTHQIIIGDRPVNLSHLPYSGDSHHDDRYQEFRPVDDGNWLICGHVHEKWRVQNQQINVGVDVWDFTPVHIDQIKEIMN